MGLLKGYGGLLLGFRCDARDSRLYFDGLKRGGFQMSGDDAGLPGWSSVIDNTEMKGPIDLQKLVFPPAAPFGGK